MRKIIYLLVFVSLSAFSQGKIDRILGDFSDVSVYDGINLEIIKSEENKVEITGNNTKFVVVKNKNGNLKIRLNLEKRFSGDRTKVTLFYKTLYSLTSHEGANVFSKDTIKQADLNLKANTGSRQNLTLDLNSLGTTAVTGATIILSGKVEYHDTSTSTGAEINAVKLITTETYANATSGGILEIIASKELEASSKLGGIINVYSKTEKIIEKIGIGGVINYRYDQ
tara:strand:+ start:27 stop:704 length:678 start_codon:yes stop_codon:yes gene_type:complete